MENEHLRIFIVEDEPVILMGFKAMAEECGYDVIGSAMDGKSALNESIRLKPDIILMDINIPEMDGIMTAEQINKVMEVPIIIITGYKNDQYVERAVNVGVYGYLQKPIDEYGLKSAVLIAVQKFNKVREEKKGREDAEQKLKERKVIECAKGILMDQFGLTEAQAMKALQKKSANLNKKLYLIAEEIVKANQIYKK